MNITDQELNWFSEEGTLSWDVDIAILDPRKGKSSLGASLQYPCLDFLKKHGFSFAEELPPRSRKSRDTFPWFIDLAEKTVYFSWHRQLHEKKTVTTLPSKLVEFCSIPKVAKQLQARNLGII